jgi:hypothetical protein
VRVSPINDWLLTIQKEKLIKISAKLVNHGRYIAFQMAGLPSLGICSAKFCGRLAQRLRETLGCDAFTPNRRETCVSMGTKSAVVGIRPSNPACERALCACGA